MNPLIRRETTILPLLVGLALACSLDLPTARAVNPPPEGGYPGNNTAVGENALQNLTTGINNTALGYRALHDNTVGLSNTAVGSLALRNNIGGDRNTATGHGALFANVAGNDNTANGFRALVSNEEATANSNTAIGSRALENNHGGHDNIALGFRAGGNFSPGSNNIYIGNVGLTGEDGTIRIGDADQTKTFIAGISGAGVTGAPLVVNASGQLGTAPSSQRFKDEIKPMDKASETIFALEPVTFRYKNELDPDGIPQFGLVAEELARINPDLIVRDASGNPYTVRYDAVNAMLLNEFLKEHRKVEELESVLTQLTARLQQQDLKVQKMSEQLAAGNYRALGWFSLPSIWFFQIILVAVTPMVDLFLLASLPFGVWNAVLPFVIIFLAMDVILATLACMLEREPLVRAWRILPMRLIYRPMLSYCIWKAILRAIKGAWVSWGKLERTASVPVRA